MYKANGLCRRSHKNQLEKKEKTKLILSVGNHILLLYIRHLYA